MPLAPQPLKVLALLVRNAGQTVSREEIQKEVWGEATFVDFEHGLNSCIRQIRAALGDEADSPVYIQTIARRGYCFVAAVQRGVVASPCSAPPLREQAPSAVWSRFAWRGTALLAALALALVWAWFPWGVEKPPASAAPARMRLLIVPFENLGGDPEQDYISEGLTEELITQVGRLQPQRLGVIARGTALRYKGKGSTGRPLDAGRELGVDYVLEGRLRREGDRLRITAQLIQMRDHTLLWTQTYEGRLEGLLDLQKEIGEKVAGSLALELLPQQPAQARWRTTANPAAYEAYLKGRYFWSKRSPEGVQRGLAYFREATSKDPAFAPAYVGIADSYVVGNGLYLGVPEREAYACAKPALAKALELDDSLPEAHATLAGIRSEHDWDWAAAESEYRRAIQLDPNSAIARIWFAEHLSAMGRHDQAIAEARRAYELDPLSLPVNLSLAMRYYFARQYDEAIRRLEKTIELEPRFIQGYRQLARVYASRGMYAEAVATCETELDLSGAGAQKAALHKAFAESGPPGFYRWRVAYLQAPSQRARTSSYQLAKQYAGLVQNNRALALLEKAFAERSVLMIWLKTDPDLDPLRSDPRFQELLRRMNFPP